MKRLLFLLLLGIVCSRGVSQNVTPIYYVFPDEVEIALDRFIQKINAKKSHSFHMRLSRITDEKYRLDVNVSSDAKINGLPYLIAATNRYLLVNGKGYPLSFDYDEIFSTPKPNEIGEFGKREGFVMRNRVIHEGFYLIFNRLGLIDEE
jgi:hypothetical protein